MIGHRDPPHYLKPITTTTTPKRLLWLDCGTSTSKEQGAYVQRWLCGALGTTHYTSRKHERKDDVGVFVDAADMWSHADAFCTEHKRTVLWSYDLAIQLRVSRALIHLPALGWKLENIVLERTSSWALFRDGKRSLMMCDIKSWAPVDFAAIAGDVGFGDAGARLFKAGEEYSGKVCMWRAGVIRDAVLQILSWIEGENLGQFRPTGSGQSYAAFRRRFHRYKLLVHDDVARLQAERTAMWTGRCEAWRHGSLTDGPYVEYDMQAAYATIARDRDVPAIAERHYAQPSLGRLQAAMNTHAVLAKITVETDVPCVPTKVGTRTAWPVGTFRTWLWDPELELALTYCKSVRVHEFYTYKRAPALHDFAVWVLDGMGEQTQVYGLVPRRVLKHWSRCLVGRLGLRYRGWEKFAHSEDTDLRLTTYVDTDEGTMTDLLIAGNEWLMLTDMQEALESLPQIPSWVMSECRRRLWLAMMYVGLDRVVYIDTDSIVVADYPEFASGFLSLGDQRWVWVSKGTYSRMTIYGPRNIVCENSRRVSGLPKTARQVAPLEFTGQVMRSIKESMRAGELDRVVNIPRRFVLDAPDLRRQHVRGGQTAPFEVQLQPTEDEV